MALTEKLRVLEEADISEGVGAREEVANIEEDDEEIEALTEDEASERMSVHSKVLVEFFKKDSAGDTLPEDLAHNEILKRSLEICKGNVEAVDSNGLPKDRRDFLRLERNIARFLRLEGFEYQPKRGRYEPLQLHVQGQADPEKQIVHAERGKLEETMDVNDPLIGEYIIELRDTANSVGKETDGLIWNRHAFASQEGRSVMFIKCLEIARDMVMHIGEERYDKVRPKIRGILFYNLSANTLLTVHPEVINEMYKKENPKGYGATLPRVWVEELMLLVKNEGLIDAIISNGEDDSTKKIMNPQTVRAWIKTLSERKKVSQNDTRIGHFEYLRKNITEDELPQYIVEDFADIVARMPEDLFLYSFPYEQRTEVNSVKKMQIILRTFLGKDTTLWRQKVSELVKFVSVVSSYDDAYREGDPKTILKSSILIKDQSLNAARAALRKRMSMVPKNIREAREAEMVPVYNVTDEEHTCQIKVFKKSNSDGDVKVTFSVFRTERPYEIIC